MELDWEIHLELPRGRSYLQSDMSEPCCYEEGRLCCGKEELEAEIEEIVGAGRPLKMVLNLRIGVFADR